MEEKEDDGENTILKTQNERRVKKEEVSAGRRTTTPKYNVVTPAEKKEVTTAE
jgi:hypothetical protein